MRALVPSISALLRTCCGVDGRTWCRGGCQLHLALGAGLCTRAEQTLPTASEADQQELSDRRDLYQGKRRGQVSVSSPGFHWADDRLSTHRQPGYRRSQTLPAQG